MGGRGSIPIVMALLSVMAGASLSWGQSAAKPSYAGEAVVIETYDTAYKYNADGTGDKTVSVKMKVQSEAGARQLSVLSFPFASDEETAAVERLVVHHADGTSLDTPASDAMTMPAPVTQQAPLYSDLKMLQIPVRGLHAGDELEYRVAFRQSKTEAPSQFWGTHKFLSKGVVLDEKLTLDVPAAKYVNVWSPGQKPVETSTAGRHVYVWKASQLKPSTAKATDDQDAADKADGVRPDVAWTTFKSWAEVGDWYRGLAAPRAAATDALRAQADDITRDAKTPEEQVRELYSFVSTRIRYVGVDFGIGRYQPHPAAEVLVNQYGDCKDKDTLFEALLHAKGFASAPALVGVNVDLVKEVPSPAFFNHVITTVTLPVGTVWADSTPGVAPFQLLMAPVRDKDVLVIPASGDARLEHTPAATPFPFRDTFEASGELTKAGELTAKMKIQFRSDSETLMRLMAQNLAPAQWDQGTQLLSNAMGFGGTTSNSNFSRPDDTRDPMQVTYDYSRKPYGDWDNFKILPLFPVLALPAPPEKQPENPIDLGAPRTETAISRIKLPDGFSADLPNAVHVKTAFASEDKTYKLENGELIVQRVLTVSESKLPPASWQAYKKFTDDTSWNDESWIQLTTTVTGQSGPHPPRPGADNPQAAALVSDAGALERTRDLDGTLKKLDEARKINPEQPFLWNNYGYVAMMRNRWDEAKQDIEKEISLHPEEGSVVRWYAGLLYAHGERDKARNRLKGYLDGHAADAEAASMLAAMYGADNQAGAAIAVLRKASEASPSNPGVLDQLGEYLVQSHQEAEAGRIAGQLLEKAGTDPLLLNNAAYLLAESDGDLSFAEQKSRQSLEILELELGRAAISEANQESFQRTSLMVAGWDTLGYILMKEKKLPEAEDYLQTSWRILNSPDTALHYGELLEQEGKPHEALGIYRLGAGGFRPPGAVSSTIKELNDRVQRLQGSKGPALLQRTPALDLQEDRTFHLKLAACADFESTTLRIQFSASGVADLLRVAGDEPTAPAQTMIKHIGFPRMVPEHSKALLLRDAVLTCSKGSRDGVLVLMPLGGIAAEQAGQR